MASQQQSSKTPLHIRDRLMTPDYLYEYFNQIFSFDGDVCAASADESRHKRFFSPEDDALFTPWSELGKTVWCNPPYSEQGVWIDTAIANAKDGVATAMLLPSFNGQAYWSKIADQRGVVYNIIGRIDFIAPEDFEKDDGKGNVIKIRKGDPVKGNTSGSCVVVFRSYKYNTAAPLKWVYRDEMRAQYNKDAEEDLDFLL